MGEVAIAAAGIVRHDKGVCSQSGLEQPQDVQVHVLCAIEEHEIDGTRKITCQCLQGVAFADLDEICESCGSDYSPSTGDFPRLELGADQDVAVVVLQRCRQANRRDIKEVPNSTIVRARRDRARM
jgi:hypothetical protein